MVWLIVWGMLLAFPGMATGQADRLTSAEVLTLDQAVSLALQHNRQVQIAALDVGKTEDQLRAAKTRRLPALRLSLTEAYTLAPIDLHFKRGDFGTFPVIGPVPSQDTTLRNNPAFHTSLMAKLAQPLSQLYGISLNIDQLDVGREIAGKNLLLQQQTIATSVKEAYYQVLQSQSALEAVEETVRAYRELDRVVEEQLKQQAVLRSDVLQAKTSLAQAESSALISQNNLATRKEQLNLLLGRPLETAFRVSPVHEALPIEAEAAGARARALNERPEVARARLQVQSAEYDLKIKRSEFIPDLSLVFSYISPLTSDVLPKNIAYVGLELSWEFFDWGRKRQEMAARGKAIQQANRALDETRDQVVLDVNSRLRKLQEARALLRVAQLGQEAAREKVRVTMNQYAQQAALLKDVLQAQAALAEANNQYQQALLGGWTARAEFERALGSVQ
jgi:outer membrane protein TolC